MDSSGASENSNLLFDQISVSVLIIGRDDGIINRVNHAVCKNLGKTYDDIVGMHYRRVFWPEFISFYDRLLEECRDGKEHSAIYYWAEMVIWEQITARTFFWENTPCILMVITDISDMTRTEYKLESISYFDNLLKLPNGSRLEEDINELANLETVALLYFDIDRIEEINSLYGWDNGDSVLRQIRDYLLFSETRRAQLYRLNNGFAILGRKVTMEDARTRAEEVLERFGRPWVVTAAGNDISLYCSIRLCIVFGKYVQNEMRNILLRTVRSIQHSPESYAVYDEEADKIATRSLMLRDSLINCAYNGMEGFDVHYQPIVEIHTERWAALEALCRWTAPNGERISPLEFIHVAEQLNLIEKIDSWVRRTAMTQCRKLGLDRMDFMLDVNFSPTSKIDERFIAEMLATLRMTGFPPDMLNLEITESAKMIFDDPNLDALRNLREAGIALTLDDFGTGYSSIANLIHISARALKTEKLFLVNIENDAYRQYLLKMLVELAHYHKMQFIAEGVETRAQLDLLRQLGADYIQGFLFAKPMPYELLREKIHMFEPM